MTYRQKLLKAVYPAFIWWNKLTGKNSQSHSNENTSPLVSLYSLKYSLINGTPFDFQQLKGKKLMLVNTASDCGYTNQFAALEKLYLKYKDKLIVIGFPAKDFNNQEKGSDKDIEEFCKQNYNVTFMLMKKSSVVRGPQQNEIYRWLTDRSLNGWNDQQPTWNFCKYIVDENGRLTSFFSSSVEPFSKEIVNAIFY